jgi:hypothetical protein
MSKKLKQEKGKTLCSINKAARINSSEFKQQKAFVITENSSNIVERNDQNLFLVNVNSTKSISLEGYQPVQIIVNKVHF